MELVRLNIRDYNLSVLKFLGTCGKPKFIAGFCSVCRLSFWGSFYDEDNICSYCIIGLNPSYEPELRKKMQFALNCIANVFTSAILRRDVFYHIATQSYICGICSNRKNVIHTYEDGYGDSIIICNNCNTLIVDSVNDLYIHAHVSVYTITTREIPTDIQDVISKYYIALVLL